MAFANSADPDQITSNEYPQHMFLLKNKKNYPRIITKYSSLTIPLSKYFIKQLLKRQNLG